LASFQLENTESGQLSERVSVEQRKIRSNKKNKKTIHGKELDGFKHLQQKEDEMNKMKDALIKRP